MCLPFRKFLLRSITGALLLLAGTFPAKAQWDVTAITQVIPPYSYYLSNWANNVIVTLNSPNNSFAIRLDIHIKGNMGVDIRTKAAFAPFNYPVVDAGIPLTMTGIDLSEYFDADNLDFVGISKQEVLDNGFPEGEYQVCVRVRNDDETLISADEPLGCSNYFQIKYAETPIPINPLCGSTITQTNVQSIIFNWTPSPGAPPWTEYTLRIVEMPDPNGSPNDALLTATTPAFFEYTTNATTFFYGPDQALLEPGKSYAWQVIAYDGESMTKFKNKGFSEACYFHFGESLPIWSPSLTNTFTPKAKKTKKTFSSSNLITNDVLKPSFSGFQFSPASFNGTLYYEFADVGEYIVWELPNRTIHLVIKYYVKDKATNQIKMVLDTDALAMKSEYHTIPAGTVLGTTVTDSKGKFSFNFILSDSLGLVAKDVYFEYGPSEFPNRYKGDLYRVARVIVDDDYYCSPDKDIIVQPFENITYGQVIAYVRSYGLGVTAETWSPDNKEYYITGKLPDVEIFILRKIRPNGVPENEGAPRDNLPAAIIKGKEVVAMSISDSKGVARFTRLVRSLSQNDKYYIYGRSIAGADHHFESAVYPYRNYWAEGPGHARFNNEYDYYKHNNFSLKLYPKYPEVYGKVMAEGSQKAIAGANVDLLKYAILFWAKDRTTKTDGEGNYSFKYIMHMITDDFGNPTGPVWGLRAKSGGYTKETMAVNNAAPLLLGQRVRHDLYLKPESTVKGKIVDEQGEGVMCHVTIEGGESVQSSMPFLVLGTNKWTPSGFILPAPSGQQKIIIDPKSSDYFIVERVENLKKGENDLGTIVVKRKEHKIKVKVIEVSAYNTYNITGDKAVPGAIVKIVNRTGEKTTGADGTVQFNFGGGDEFTIAARGPEDKDYIAIEKTFSNISISEEYVTLVVQLVRATRISGHVYAGNSPVNEATVKLKNWSGPVPVETKTGKNGYYELRNVPVGNGLTFVAMKSQSQFVGDQKTLDLNYTPITDIDFNLTVFNDMDITTLLGFPIQVASLSSTTSGVKISGEFTTIPGNSQFAPSNANVSIPFTDIYIKPGQSVNSNGVPYAYPKTLPLNTDINTLPLKVHTDFFALQRNKTNGLQIIDGGSGLGVIQALTFINVNESFMDVNLQFTTDSLYVQSPGNTSKPDKVKTIKADGTSAYGASELLLCDQDGKDISYILYGFNMEAKEAGSRIAGKKVFLNSVLHTNLQKITPADLAVEMGDIPISYAAVETVSGSKPLNIPIDKWQVKADKWSFSKAGFLLNQGIVKTHLVDVPFVNMKLKPTILEYGSFDLSKLSLNGVVDLHLDANVSFYPEGANWKLAISQKPGQAYSGYIPTLPGMAPGVQIPLVASYLLSNGTGFFNLENKDLKIYDLVNFKPTDLLAYDNKIKFQGTINLNMPNVGIKSTALIYEKKGAGLELSLQPFSFGFFTNGVDLNFTNQLDALRPEGFFTKGTLSEPGLYSINVELRHAKTKTEILDIPGQNLNIDKGGNRKLANIDGEMHLAGKAWTNFIFSGDLLGTTGAEGKLTFEIKGEVVANNQSVAVKNVNTPFGGMSFVYDFEKGKLIGTLQIEKELKGTGYVSGMAESVVDGSGWYFCGGGKMTMQNNPHIKEAAAAMLFGDYPSASDPFVLETFKKYAYKGKLPQQFQNSISGFFIDGNCKLPVPYVPDINIDLVVVHGRLKVTLGGDFNLGMHFSGDGNTYMVGAATYLHAHIGLGGSVGIACAGASLDGNFEMAYNGTLHSSGSWMMEGSNNFTITGSAYAGGGCCNSDCERPDLCPAPCIKDSWSGSKSFGVTLHMGSDDNYVKVNW